METHLKTDIKLIFLKFLRIIISQHAPNKLLLLSIFQSLVSIAQKVCLILVNKSVFFARRGNSLILQQENVNNAQDN